MKTKLAAALLAATLTATGSVTAGAANGTVLASSRAIGTTQSGGTASSGQAPAPIETPAGAQITAISFDRVEDIMRRNNPNMLSVTENLARLDAFDREKAYEDLLDIHNGMTDMIWMMSGSNPIGAMSLQAQQEQLQTQLDALKADEYALTYEDSKRQIESALDQIVYMGETLYLQTVALEQTLADGRRGLAALDRQIVQAEKAVSIGMMAPLDLINLKNTRASTASQLDSLAYNIQTCKFNLQLLLGGDPTGELTLAPLPAVTEAQIRSRNYTADLGSGMAANLSIYQARRTMDDAKEELDDMSGYGYKRKMQEHVYQSAQYSYQAACQNFKLSFQTLSNAVTEKQRLLGVAQSALTVAQKNYAASENQYRRGQMSEMDFKSAQDKLADAKSAVTTARNDLFSAYTQYNWAVRGQISNAS